MRGEVDMMWAVRMMVCDVLDCVAEADNVGGLADDCDAATGTPVCATPTCYWTRSIMTGI